MDACDFCCREIYHCHSSANSSLYDSCFHWAVVKSPEEPEPLHCNVTTHSTLQRHEGLQHSIVASCSSATGNGLQLDGHLLLEFLPELTEQPLRCSHSMTALTAHDDFETHAED
mmetsp:Transcript_2032/g.3323  ORF Transcript_2032/g.3323 Transcript_2032/m.3323 type:complete len:114 (+) Transcript_2032:803-1144(+)